MGIHKQRLISSGDFGLMVIHALSHIKAKGADMSNDLDPLFLKELYRNLRLLNQDLFRKSSSSTKPTFKDSMTKSSSNLYKDTVTKSSSNLLPGTPKSKPSLIRRGSSFRLDTESLKDNSNDNSRSEVKENNGESIGSTTYFSVESMHHRMQELSQEGSSAIP